MGGLSAERQAAPEALWPQVRRLREEPDGQATGARFSGWGPDRVLATRPEGSARRAAHAGLVRPRALSCGAWSRDLTQGLVSSQSSACVPPRAGGAHTEARPERRACVPARVGVHTQGPVQRGGLVPARAEVHTRGPVQRERRGPASPPRAGCTHRGPSREQCLRPPRG